MKHRLIVLAALLALAAGVLTFAPQADAARCGWQRQHRHWVWVCAPTTTTAAPTTRAPTTTVRPTTTPAPTTAAPTTTGAPTTTTGAPTTTVSPPPGQRLIFSDDFNSLNPVWRTRYEWGGASTCDTPLPDGWNVPGQVTTSGGQLVIRAERKPVSGNGCGTVKTYPWSTGVVSTFDTFSFQYGTVEWVATWNTPAAQGKGLWPALWMLATEGVDEIDAMEILGDDPTTIYSNVHWGAVNNQLGPVASQHPLGTHTYRVEWQPNSIRWLIDGTLVASTNRSVSSRMYLLMNLAVGGNWPGATNGQTQSPAQFTVDSVRVWQ